VLQGDTSRAWRVAIDTSLASPDDIDEKPTVLGRPSYMEAAHTVVVLVR
jgi:hypothetical protein